MKNKIAIIRIRGNVGLNQGIKETLKRLKLHKKNYCTVIENNVNNSGMIKKVKDYVTYGFINEETSKLLKEKRGEKTKTKDGKAVDKKFFRLHPPRKGFERKGIKVSFGLGGALGNRKEKINDLIKRML